MLTYPFLFSLLSLCGCPKKSNPPPFVHGHRISGLGPENSLNTLPYAIRDKYLGIEVDIGLTKDLIPVLHHDPWVSKKECTHTDETSIKKRHLIRDYDFVTLQELFRCGQTEQSIGTPIPSLADLLQELSTHPDVILNLDIKYDPKYTLEPTQFFASIRSVMNHYSRSPFIITTNNESITHAFQNQPSIITFLDYPNFTSQPNFMSNIWIVLQTKIGLSLGLIDYIRILERARADGISIPYQIASQRDFYEVKQAGYLVQLWTPNTEKKLSEYCKWPIDILITDFPQRAICFSETVQREALERFLSHKTE